MKDKDLHEEFAKITEGMRADLADPDVPVGAVTAAQVAVELGIGYQAAVGRLEKLVVVGTWTKAKRGPRNWYWKKV